MSPTTTTRSGNANANANADTDTSNHTNTNTDDNSNSNSNTEDDSLLGLRDGLVTSETTSLAKCYGIHHPLDRMAVTANGNLQRLFSSYYDAPVKVVVDYCRRDPYPCPYPYPHYDTDTDTDTDTTSDTDATNYRHLSSSLSLSSSSEWHRRVHLTVFEQTFCTADSIVQVHNAECQALVESGQVGLGQLFRYLDVLPEFALQAAGPTLHHNNTNTNANANANADADGGDFWRNYTLTCAQVTCSIHEVFVPGAWNLKPAPKPASALDK